MDKNIEAFLIYITLFNLIHLAKKTQIVVLLIKKIIISNKYLDFINNFLEQKALVLLDITNLN